MSILFLSITYLTRMDKMAGKIFKLFKEDQQWEILEVNSTGLKTAKGDILMLKRMKHKTPHAALLLNNKIDLKVKLHH